MINAIKKLIWLERGFIFQGFIDLRKFVMTFIYILLIATGGLPLTTFLSSRKNYRFVLANGTKTVAQVTDVRTMHFQRGRSYDRMYFAYQPAGSCLYKSGEHKFKVGTYVEATGSTFSTCLETQANMPYPASRGTCLC